MTTRTYSSLIAHTTDADFRAWGSELSSNLQAAGLVKTADTGQINWSTVTKPTTANAVGGYEFLSLPDASIVFKLEYGNSVNTAIPGIFVTVGSATNGLGAFVGVTTVRESINPPLNMNTTSAFPTYICVTNDFFGFVFKANCNTTNGAHLATFMCGKTVDGNGAATGIGYYTLYYSTQGNGGFVEVYAQQCVRVSGSNPRIVVNMTRAYSLAVGHLTSSLVDNGNQQAFTCWGAFPDVQPLGQVCSVVSSEVQSGVSFQNAMVGTTPRTFLCIQDAKGHMSFDTAADFSAIVGGVSGFALYSPCMLWE